MASGRRLRALRFDAAGRRRADSPGVRLRSRVSALLAKKVLPVHRLELGRDRDQRFPTARRFRRASRCPETVIT
jgi:hypothetical protein